MKNPGNPLLLVGATLTPPGVTLAQQPWLQASILVDDVIPFSYTNFLLPPPAGSGGSYTNTGTIHSRVVKTIGGTLDFYWRVTLDNNSQLPLHGMILSGFRGPKDNYSWAYRTDGVGDVGFTSATRAANGTTYTFAFGLSQGKSTMFLFAETQATSYIKTAKIVLYDAQSESSLNEYLTYTP